MTSPLGFKARMGSAFFALCGGICDIHSLRFTSGATPLPVYNASIAASCLPHMQSPDVSAGVRGSCQMNNFELVYRQDHTTLWGGGCMGLYCEINASWVMARRVPVPCGWTSMTKSITFPQLHW